MELKFVFFCGSILAEEFLTSREKYEQEAKKHTEETAVKSRDDMEKVNEQWIVFWKVQKGEEKKSMKTWQYKEIQYIIAIIWKCCICQYKAMSFSIGIFADIFLSEAALGLGLKIQWICSYHMKHKESIYTNQAMIACLEVD